MCTFKKFTVISCRSISAHDRAFKLSFKVNCMSVVTLIKKRTYILKVSENHFREAEVQVVINWILLTLLMLNPNRTLCSRLLVNHHQPEINLTEVTKTHTNTILIIQIKIISHRSFFFLKYLKKPLIIWIVGKVKNKKAGLYIFFSLLSLKFWFI